MLVTTLVAISIIIHVNDGSPESRIRNIVGLSTGTGDTTGLNVHFAPADDPFTESPTPYLEAEATTDETGSKVEITVGKESGVLKQYVYTKGYYSNGSAWKNFTFSEQPVSNSPWILGEASYVSGYEKFRTNGENYVVVFVCRKYSAEQNFFCGPHTPMNSSRKNWTITVFEAPEYTAPVYLCPNNEGRFCGAPTLSLTGKNMSFANIDLSTCGSGMTCEICPGTQLCYQCADDFTNVSGRCFSQDFTCPAGPNQYCASGSQQYATSYPQGGTCPSTAACHKCIDNYKLQNGACVFDMSKVNCEIKPNQICLASAPVGQSTKNETPGTICEPGEYCWACDSGYMLENGQCVQQCPDCRIGTACIANGATNTLNSCQYCNTTLSNESWSTKPPACRNPLTVACNEPITSTTGCGSCTGTGTMCGQDEECKPTGCEPIPGAVQNFKILDIKTVTIQNYYGPSHAIAVTYCKEKDATVNGLNIVIKSHISSGGPENGISSSIKLCSDPNVALSNTTYEYAYLFSTSQGGQATQVQAYFSGTASSTDAQADNTKTVTITLSSCADPAMCNFCNMYGPDSNPCLNP
jgi:hypothetical protein